MVDDCPAAPMAPSLLTPNISAEEAWADPVVIRAATGDLLARLAWVHGDDEIDREVRS